MGLDSPSRLRSFAICAIATLVMTVSYIDRQTLAALAPTVRPALHLSQTQYGWITGAFSIAYLVFAPLSGALIDRVGARRAIVWAVVAWSVVASLHAFVPGFAVLFVLRALLGASESPSFPAAAQTVRRMLPPEHRGAGFGLIFTGSSVGGMIVAPIAIALATRYGWRTAFVLVAAIGFSWVPLWIVATRAKDVRERLDAADEGAKPRLGRADLSAVARAVVLVIASAPPIMFVLNWYAQVLKDAFHVPQERLGAYLWLPPLFFDIGSVGFGFLGGRRPSGERRDLVGVAALLSAAIALAPHAPGAVSATVVGGVSMLGGGALYALLFGEVASRTARERLGAVGGICASAQSITHVIGAPLIGRSIDQAGGSYAPAMHALGALVLPGALAWILWPRFNAR